jgi:hypothetical protein
LTTDPRLRFTKTGTFSAMDNAKLAMLLARARIVIGAAALIAPRFAARVMGGKDPGDSLAPLFARMLGARDIALGLGTVIAMDRGKPVRGWLEGSALSDGVDFLACTLAREQMSPAAYAPSAGLGAASAVACILLSRQLDPPPPAHPGQPEAVATGHSPSA